MLHFKKAHVKGGAFFFFFFTFLSGDFVAKTGMWLASSGHQSGAIVFPSSSPYNHPGEFSSPEIHIYI